MKLTNFEELRESIKPYNIKRFTKLEILFFYKTGINTDLSDIFSIEGELITILNDGLIHRTIVYISEIKSWYLEEYSYPKFHIFNCKTLIKMRENNKKDRYKKTLRDDGKFLMVISGKILSRTEFVPLEVCGNCLFKYNKKYNLKLTKDTFNIKKYQKDKTKNNFEINDNLDNFYFEDDLETVPSFYADNWKEISNEMKRKNNYICQKCKINLKKAKYFLHTHHNDSNISNNNFINLKVLCIKCHSNEFNHAHLKINIFYKKFENYLSEI